ESRHMAASAPRTLRVVEMKHSRFPVARKLELVRQVFEIDAKARKVGAVLPAQVQHAIRRCADFEAAGKGPVCVPEPNQLEEPLHDRPSRRAVDLVPL